jgi:hypothetical protein
MKLSSILWILAIILITKNLAFASDSSSDCTAKIEKRYQEKLISLNKRAEEGRKRKYFDTYDLEPGLNACYKRFPRSSENRDNCIAELKKNLINDLPVVWSYKFDAIATERERQEDLALCKEK